MTVILERLLEANQPQPPVSVVTKYHITVATNDKQKRAAAYLAKLPPAISGERGHDRTYAAACRVVIDFDMSVDEAWPVIAKWNERCQPPWSEPDLRRKLDEANKQPGERGRLLVERNGYSDDDDSTAEREAIQGEPLLDHQHVQQVDKREAAPTITPLDVVDLTRQHPKLHAPIIEGLLREQETANIIANPKMGKSWLSYGLALSVAIGEEWLGRFRCRLGRVLLIDNELHPATLAHRLRTVAEAMSLRIEDCASQVSVLPLRGRLLDLNGISHLLKDVEPGTYDLIVLDAFYRALPGGVSENDNAGVAGLYNTIDVISQRLACAWVNIHHSSKGSQAEKAVSDVGAGAGAQSRAADAHLILRPHDDPGIVVLEAVVRSFPPVEPSALKWCFPLWIADGTADPTKLRGRLNKAEARQRDRDKEGRDKLLATLLSGPKNIRELRAAIGAGGERTNRLLDQLEAANAVTWDVAQVKGGKSRVYRLKEDEDGTGPVSGPADQLEVKPDRLRS